VTDADIAAERCILERLTSLLPGIPVISEEWFASGPALAHDGRQPFVLVDPLDGTKEFLARNGEFKINLAVIAGGRPLAGAIHAPASQRVWYAGEQAYTADAAPDSPVRGFALVSRSHRDAKTDHFLDELPIGERRVLGSSLKFCEIAEGAADLYPRLGPTMDWDVAAGDAILTATGGRIETPHGARLLYGKAAVGYRNEGFVAWGAVRSGRPHMI
jgi:3'(2'), 5'-bisphosphate nucleotidase